MLTDIGTGCGERIVLTDQANRIRVASFLHQRDVTGDVHAGGTQRDTGHGVLQTTQAAVMQDMFLIIVPEALQAHQDQIGRVDPDGTIRAVHDDLGGIFDPAQDAYVRLPVQHFTDHVGDLAEANTAGHALAAGLSLTQVQKIQGHIHRAQARGAGRDSAFHVPVQLFHDSLRLAGSLYFQSTHDLPTLSLVLSATGPLPRPAGRADRFFRRFPPHSHTLAFSDGSRSCPRA